MRHDVIDHVDVVGMIQIGDEADRFGVRHGSGECLSEGRHAWKLNDARLFVVVRAEILREVVERLFQRVHHARNIPRVSLVVVHLELDAVPIHAGHFVARGNERIETQRRMIELVPEIAAAAVLPFAQKRSWRNRDLVGRSADDGIDVDPIHMATEVRLHAMFGAIPFENRHEHLLPEAVLFTIIRVRDLVLIGIADNWRNGVVEKSSVLHDCRVAHFVLEAARMGLDADMNLSAFSGLERGRKTIDLIVEPLVVLN